MTTRIAAAGVSEEPLDVAAIVALTEDPRAGATVTFTGVVRDHDGGRAVTAIEYSAHPSAGEVLAGLAAEFGESEGVHALAVVHRVGNLRVGDVALVAVAAASHRQQAFAVASGLVERVKQALPVWKRQLFTDGTAEWSNLP